MSDLGSLKPAFVKLVLEAGRMIEDNWGPSLKMLGDMKFLDSFKTFEKVNISVLIKKIRDTYIADRDFLPEKKKVSTACVAKIAGAEGAQPIEKLNAKCTSSYFG